jgi:MATE family multidrug resistance protein
LTSTGSQLRSIRKMRRTNGSAPIITEVRATLALATPLAAANLAQMAMGFTDTVMVGHLGSVALAAAGLGGLLYFTTGFVLQGVISAVCPLAAHALGAGDDEAVSRIGGQGLAIAALLSVPLIIATACFSSLLLDFGYDPKLAREIGQFLAAIAWGAPALLGFGALRSLLAAFARTRPVMIVVLACVPANVSLNWILIYGHLGAPALGVAGAGIASAIVQWLMLGGLALHLGAMPNFAARRVFRNALKRYWGDFSDILRVGAPIGGLLTLEVGVFVAVGVLMGLIGANALGANQIALNIATITYMVPLGISQAATVRCAFELGAGRARAARRAGWVALGLGASFMAAAAIGLVTAPRAIIAMYLNVDAPANKDVVELALRLIVIAAAFQVFDGTQSVAAGILRGYKDTAVPMLLAGISYWGCGFVGGFILAFPLGYGASGLWWGLAFGLALAALLLCLRLGRFSRLANASAPT